MKLVKLSIVASVAALVLSSSAFAAQTGAFAGVDLGYGATHYSVNDFSVPGASVSVKKTGLAYGINGGYNFNNYFGVEAEANRDASVKTTVTLGSETKSLTAKTYDIDVLADGYLPVGDNFDLIGKAGMAYVRTSIDGLSQTQTNYRPKLAVGAGYTATDNVYVSATYSRIFKQDSDTKYLPNVDVAAISVDYLF